MVVQPVVGVSIAYATATAEVVVSCLTPTITVGGVATGPIGPVPGHLFVPSMGALSFFGDVIQVQRGGRLHLSDLMSGGRFLALLC